MSVQAVGRAPERILVVDDEEQVRNLLSRMLGRHGWSCETAADGREARAHMEEGTFEILLCDLQLPGESGLEIVRDMLAAHPDTAAVMVTGLDDPNLADLALEIGAYGYVTKPFKRHEVVIGVSNALRRRRLEIENRSHRQRLEQVVDERTRELQVALARLERSAADLQVSREQSIGRLCRAVEYRDGETGGHIERVSRYCELLAEPFGLHPQSMRTASPMHDVGKIAVEDHILRKPGRLTAGERRLMEQHAEIGWRLLTGSGGELLELAATIAWTHHEKFDGSGYPRGLAGEGIPPEGRVAAVADVFDALTSDRVYRPAFELEEALEIMRADRGRHFDPAILDLFLDRLDGILEIRERYAAEESVGGESAPGPALAALDSFEEAR